MIAIEVYFRKESGGEILAAFPYEGGGKFDLLCYSHSGQHNSCTFEYLYRHTKAAKPEEYDSLLREVRKVYAMNPQVELKVKTRLPSLKSIVRYRKGEDFGQKDLRQAVNIIRKSKGIDIQGLSEKLRKSLATTQNIVYELENRNEINVDLLQRCTIKN